MVAARVRPRIGDVVVVATDPGLAMVRSVVEPGGSAIIGMHGGDSDAERLVPLLSFGGEG